MIVICIVVARNVKNFQIRVITVRTVILGCQLVFPKKGQWISRKMSLFK